MRRLLVLSVVATLVAAVAGLTALVLGSRLPLTPPAMSAAAPVARAAPSVPAAPPWDSAVARGQLFRVGRQPPSVPFDPLGNAPAAPVVEPRPAFALVGVMLGAVRLAVIRGIPGDEAAQVVAEGEERAGLRVARVEPGGVAVVWRSDSLWLELPKEGSR